MSLDKKTLVHIAVEAAVLGVVSTYLLNRVSHLENELKELRADLQIVAKRQLKTEQNHAQAIRSVAAQPANRAPEGGQPATQHNHHAHQPAVNHAAHRAIPPVTATRALPPATQPVHRAPPQPIQAVHRAVQLPAQPTRKVQFSDEPEADSDEELLEEEFGPPQTRHEERHVAPPVRTQLPSRHREPEPEPEDEEEPEESSEEEVQVVSRKRSGKKPAASLRVPSAAKKGGNRDMDDIKARAAAMARAAGPAE